MTQYGYRIFVIEALNGTARSPQDFSKLATWAPHGGQPALEHLYGALYKHQQHRYTEVPVQIPTLPRKDEKPFHMQFDQLSKRQARIDGSFHFGREGDFPALSELDPGTGVWKNAPMGKRAPVRPYRVWFHIPPKGAAGIVVAESIGRVNAGQHLVKILNSISHNDLCYATGVADRQSTGWLRWRITPAVDDQRLESFIKEMHGGKIRLTRNSRTGAGARSTGAMTIEQDISDMSPDLLRALVRSWERNSKRRHDKAVLQRLGARTAGVFFGDLFDSSEFDSAELVADEHGQNQRVSPEALDRLFEYPQGDSPPSNQALMSHAGTTIRRMVRPMSSYKINLADLNL